MRGEVAQFFSGSGVEETFDPPRVCLINICEGRLFREELSDKAIGIFIGTPFPGVVGVSEIYLSVCFSCDHFMSREFSSIIIRDRMSFLSWYFFQSNGCFFCDRFCSCECNVINEGVATFSINVRNQ